MDKSSNIKAKPSKTGPDTLFPNISRNAKTNQNNNTYQNISKIAGFSTSWCQQSKGSIIKKSWSLRNMDLPTLYNFLHIFQLFVCLM